MSVRRAKRLPLEELEPYLLPIPDPLRPLDLSAIFGNTHPVEVEVGFGKGAFLVAAAQTRPETNFLGIEIERKYQLFTATRVAKRALRNVRLVCGDAREFLREGVLPRSVQAVHVYFPDPWWKNRHRKRRVFTADFAAACTRVLLPGGRLFVATDVEEYFEVITTLLAATEGLERLRLSPNPSTGLEVVTNFERKSLEQGRAVHRAVYQALA